MVSSPSGATAPTAAIVMPSAFPVTAPGTQGDRLIEIAGVEKVFGDPNTGHRALEAINISIMEKEFFTLLGPSGCGKTTLLRMIAG